MRTGYPAWWSHTARPPAWHYATMPTTQFLAGASLPFETDDYGADVLAGVVPPAHSGTGAPPAEARVEVHNRAGALLRTAFDHARALGVRTCIGTQVPLAIPAAVAERLRAAGQDPGSPAVLTRLYEGMFRRAAAAHRPDWFWVWTPEGWTWRGDTPAQASNTVAAIGLALAGLEAAGRPFPLATAGWVLGPKADRTAFDRLLPKDSPMAALSRRVGHEWVDASFDRVEGRPKWAMLWIENDGNLTAPQLWAGRLRYDAADARRYGCTGLVGKHWRTDPLAPQASSFAAAAWDQPWLPDGFLEQGPAAPADERRAIPVEDFYADFCRVNFGASAATNIAAVFARMDGRRLPEVCAWKGPGWIKANRQPWSTVAPGFSFVVDLEKLRPLVRGAGNLDRFDYWLDTFRGHRLMARIGCASGALEKLMAELERLPEAARKAARAREEALPLRRELAQLWPELIRTRLATLRSSGGLGSLANLEQLNRQQNGVVQRFDTALQAMLGEPLPPDCAIAAGFDGAPRVTVPTVRSHAASGEALRLKIVVLDRASAESATLYWRPFGAWRFRAVRAEHAARAVYFAELPGSDADVEYYISVVTAGGRRLRWPAAAPAICQTVVRLPAAKLSPPE